VFLEEKISRKSFVRLGAAVGVGAAVSSTLAACGGGSGGQDSGGGNGGGAEGPATSSGEKTGGSGGQAIASVSQVRPGSAVKIRNKGNPAVLVHLQSGDFVAYSAVCTHQGCTVAYKDGQLACPCHGSVFDPRTGGSVVNGPATQPLPQIPVEVRGGRVFLA
jgi:arsenite oxidase small subunit